MSRFPSCRNAISGYMIRHKVRPGIKGWAQINGFRGETDTVEKMKARIEHDLALLSDWSLFLDLSISARTTWLIAPPKLGEYGFGRAAFRR
jgi:putative colanic acid biosynthesis UDP-glucose lipid carrier transferase